MKGKGKWAVLLLVLGFAFAGCFGSPGGSSDEGAVSAADNPVLGTWQVTIDPQNASVQIVPVTLGANSLEPAYSWTNEVTVTDLVNRAQATEDIGPLIGTTPIDLANKNLIPGSERVTNGAARCVKGVDYTITYFAGLLPGKIARVGASACIVSGDTVTVRYGYGASGNAAWDGGSNTLTLSMSIENHLNATLEKVRTWTGTVDGTGAPANPTIAVNYADYPLIQPQNVANYAKPSITAQLIEGWTAGICYNTWGKWDDPLIPRVEGCKLVPRGVVNYNPGWVDPVCARVTETVAYTGTASSFNFYMQLTGDVNPWSPDYTAFPGGADPRFNKTEYSTWYALMSYLVPDAPGIQYPAVPSWCSGVLATAANQVGWRTGSLTRIAPGDNRHCGTLITDPHLPGAVGVVDTYFAVNYAIEYSDTIEKQNKAFWDAYIANPLPDAKQAVGAPYLRLGSIGVLYDNQTLDTFSLAGRTGHSGSTWFPGGFANNHAANAQINSSLGMKLRPAGISAITSIDAATGIIIAAQMINPLAYANSNFTFFSTGGTTVTFPYITGPNCAPANMMPKWAGQWGVAHYDVGCNFITEGADADLDYFIGMNIFKIKSTAIAGDYGFIRFDQSGNNSMEIYYNNMDASNHPSHLGGASEDLGTGYCVQAGGGMAACPPSPGLNWAVYNAIEYPNPVMPPGQSASQSSYVDCANGSFTCGGHQYVMAVVCVQ